MAEFPPQEIFRHIVDGLEVGVYVVDRARKIQYWNRGAEHITGYLAHNVVGRFCRDNILVHCDDHNPNLCKEECPLTEAMRVGEAYSGQIYLRHHSGYRIPVDVRVLPLRGEDGAVTGAVEVFTEQVGVSGFASQNQVFAACGCLDEPTGVPNHALTESYLREQLDLLQRHKIPFAAFLVRADRLKDFHALHGHDAEVAILQALARTLRHSLRPTDFLGRWGEDRFVVMLPYSVRTPLEPAVERLRHVVSCTVIPWWGDMLSVSISAGLVKAEDADTLESLKARIDACLREPEAPETQSGKA
jgi:diguanylate cyclase (GGDEF)-like protein/PAS domain S-box-containing protein